MQTIEFARRIPRNCSRAEGLLWLRLQSAPFAGVIFRRRQPIGPYVVDFVCFDHRVTIDLDGDDARFTKHYDPFRETWLCQSGFTVLKYWQSEVESDLDAVCESIKAALTPRLPKRA